MGWILCLDVGVRRSTPTSRHKICASFLGVMFTNIRCHPNTLGKFFAKAFRPYHGWRNYFGWQNQWKKVERFCLSKNSPWTLGSFHNGYLKFNELVVINSYDLCKKKNLCKGLRWKTTFNQSINANKFLKLNLCVLILYNPN